MKFTKPSSKEGDHYSLHLDQGESLDLFFSPDGTGTRLALSVRGAVLPNGEQALKVWLVEDLLHREVSALGDAPAPLVLCRGFGARRAEFALNEDDPWRTLTLERVDLGALLARAMEEMEK